MGLAEVGTAGWKLVSSLLIAVSTVLLFSAAAQTSALPGEEHEDRLTAGRDHVLVVRRPQEEFPSSVRRERTDPIESHLDVFEPRMTSVVAAWQQRPSEVPSHVRAAKNWRARGPPVIA